MRRSSVGSVSVHWKAGPISILGWHPREVFPAELTSDEEMERNLGEWRRMNVLYECDGMNIFIVYLKKRVPNIMPPNHLREHSLHFLYRTRVH